MSETITAMYDSRADADAAADKLAEAGISRSNIQVMAGSTANDEFADTLDDSPREEGGFWATLKSLFMPDEDRYSYAEGIRRGSTVLSVTVAEADVGLTSGILEEYGAVDVQQRASEWKADGWSGYASEGAAAQEASALSTPSGMATPEPTDPLLPSADETPALGPAAADRGMERPRFDGPGRTAAEASDLGQAGGHSENLPLDRPASTPANGLFGAPAADPADLPIGSPGARADVEEDSRDVGDDIDYPGVTPEQPRPAPKPDVRRGF
ncbi:hypothetical protein [Labrys monachus]|uniref:General stress protein 17M-like domain-containing protein n=1 Tax=Labrys monachus TaxID=217067 RepID=A0ABU0FH87_9HYPH|nr:hypothetical protein [Labrys monachus]MDQ0393891.1 hypothetical protein [Labrys monachus]